MDRLESCGLTDVSVFYGINGLEMGIEASKTYTTPDNGFSYRMVPQEIGCYLSHWAIWSALDLMHRHSGAADDYWMIVEDDVTFLDGWKQKVEEAVRDLPSTWDMLFAGSCCVGDKPKAQIRPGLFETTPLCTHCYIVRAKALPVLLATNREAVLKIDQQMLFNSFPKLRVFAMLPRVAEQGDMPLPV